MDKKAVIGTFSVASFEDRANLFILMERLKEFLQIKHDFMIAQNNRPSIQ